MPTGGGTTVFVSFKTRLIAANGNHVVTAAHRQEIDWLPYAIADALPRRREGEAA